ncbi:Metallo-dependent phosphatase [Wallemia mellicola]|nr:Metallo-dependent phosphatase [Wallemia mellicola]
MAVIFIAHKLKLTRKQIPGRIFVYAITLLYPAYIIYFLKSKNTRSFSSSPVKALLFGIPSNDNQYNWANFIVNTIIFAMTQDFLWSPLLLLPASNVAFARLGHVTDVSAKVVARVPPPNWVSQDSYDGTDHEPLARVIYKTRDSENSWLDGPTFAGASPESDWMDAVTLENLWPSNDYDYSVVYLDGKRIPGIPETLPLRTSPDPKLTSIKASMWGGNGGTKLSFVSGSCVTLGFPYRPAGHFRIPGFDLLAEHIKKHTMDFMIFLGDFIYADIPLSIGTSPENYWRKYRQTMSSDSFRKVYEQLPFYHMYDDHEIANNYAGQDNLNVSPYREAMIAWKAYNSAGNPDALTPNHSYFSFDYGDVAFFTLDTRAHRSANQEDDGPEKTMLGETQKIALLEWLSEVNNTATFKFISSSVPLTQLWKGVDGHLDTWAGFKNERKWLLDILQYVPNVIILSGDRHEAAAVELRDAITEFSTSPLSQFSVPIRTFKQDHTEWIKDVVRKEDLKHLYPYLVSDGKGRLSHPDSLIHTTVEDGDYVTISKPEDRVLAYLPDGFVKWTTFDVDTTSSMPTVNATIWIDGKATWSKVINGKPIRQSSSALSLIDSVGDIFDSIGMKIFSFF